ncbi:MAG TPA: ABC transporter permease [Candidatus Acidoferrum sp.]|nr:ABC transporter permease [Candidatus Acidoferrum sp.]
MRSFWKAFKRNKLALIGGVVVACLALLAVLAPAISPWDPNRPDVKRILEPPSGRHLFGTDQLGRDVLSRMLYGSQVSLAVGFVSVGIAATIGILLGAAAGYHGGLVDAATMRLVDLMLVFPRFFLLLAVLAFLKPSIWTIMTVIGFTGWMGVARLVRAEFLALKEREFVMWSQSTGASAFRIIWRHILPNAMGPVLVAMTLGIPAAILTESGLSFLGLGVQPPRATWGNILNEGKDAIELAWWLSVYPGLAILATVLSYNLLGEGIRDALDPRLRQSAGRVVSRSR